MHRPGGGVSGDRAEIQRRLQGHRRRQPRRQRNRQPDAAHEHPQCPHQADEKSRLWRGYEYDHDTEEGFSGDNYFPEGMGRPDFYRPVERGFEREIVKRLAYWAKLREEKP